MNPDAAIFEFTDPSVSERFFDVVRSLFLVRDGKVQTFRETLYDTFDWKLLGKGKLVVQTGASWSLQTVNRAEILSSEKNGRRIAPLSLDALAPESELRTALAPLIHPRALVPMATIEVRRQVHPCLNDDRKTVLRVVVEERKVAEGARAGTYIGQSIRVEPLRGYAPVAATLLERAASGGLFPATDPSSPTLHALSLAGAEPNGYSSRIDLTLDPLASTREAAREIHRHSLSAMRANLPGMREDIDIEFLHDFRVAVRRTRSALSLIRGVYPKEEVTRYKSLFSNLGRQTNRLRDLDVYLPKQDAYRARIPDFLRPALDLYFESLREERKSVRRKLVKDFAPKRVDPELDRWESFLESRKIPTDDCPNARLPVEPVARKLLAKRLGKILAEGRALTPGTPDSQFHELRIDFKKIRYLTEFFSSLFPPGELNPVVKALRKIQNILGDLNDIAVQQESLRGALDGLDPSAPGSIDTAAAIGALARSFDEGKAALRNDYFRAFAKLTSAGILASIENLFGPKPLQSLRT